MPTHFKQKVPGAGAVRRLLAIIFIAFAAAAAQTAGAHEAAPPHARPPAAAPAAAPGTSSGSTDSSARLPSGAGAGTPSAAPAPTFATPDGATPRVSARGDHLEITALGDHGVLTLYLDDYATNTPVTDAQVIVELGSASGTAAPQPDGSYRWAHDTLEAAAAGTVLRITVAAGSDAEQIDLRLPGTADGAAHADASGAPRLPRSAWIGIAAAAVAALLLAFALWRRARRSGPALPAPAGH